MNVLKNNQYPVRRKVAAAICAVVGAASLAACTSKPRKPVAVSPQQSASFDKAATEAMADGLDVYTTKAADASCTMTGNSDQNTCVTVTAGSSLYYTHTQVLHEGAGEDDIDNSVTITEGVGLDGLNLTMRVQASDANYKKAGDLSTNTDIGYFIDDSLELVNPATTRPTAMTAAAIRAFIHNQNTHFVSVSTDDTGGYTSELINGGLFEKYDRDYFGDKPSTAGTAPFVAAQLAEVIQDLKVASIGSI